MPLDEAKDIGFHSKSGGWRILHREVRENPGSGFFYKPRVLDQIILAVTCQPYLTKFGWKKRDFMGLETLPE